METCRFGVYFNAFPLGSFPVWSAFLSNGFRRLDLRNDVLRIQRKTPCLESALVCMRRSLGEIPSVPEKGPSLKRVMSKRPSSKRCVKKVPALING